MRYDLPLDTIDWLIHNQLPTVRYQALVSIAGLSESDPKAVKAGSDIVNEGPVAKILEKQQPSGHWGDEEYFYQRSKYKGTVWNIIAMAELMADGKDDRIRKACEFILDASQVRSSGGFAYKGTRESGGKPGKELSCLTSNLIWSLTVFGMGRDERVLKGIDWIVENQRFSMSPVEPGSSPYDHSMCWVPHECRSSAVKSLRALSAIPEKYRSREIDNSIEKGRSFVEKMCLGIGAEGLRSSIRKEWMDIGCPNMWNTDILEIASVLRSAGSRYEDLKEVKLAPMGSLDPEKRMTQQSPFTNRYLTKIEKFGEPSGLLTIRAFQLFN